MVFRLVAALRPLSGSPGKQVRGRIPGLAGSQKGGLALEGRGHGSPGSPHLGRRKEGGVRGKSHWVPSISRNVLSMMPGCAWQILGVTSREIQGKVLSPGKGRSTEAFWSHSRLLHHDKSVIPIKGLGA